MVSTMNVWGNTATPMFGNNLQSFLITCPWPQWLKTRCSAYTAASHQVLTHWTRSASLIESRRHLTRDPSVIYSGLTLMTGAVGASALVELATASARTSPNSSTTQITWQGSPEHINWSWMDTIGRTRGTLWRSSQRPTTATDAAMRPR